MSGWVRIKLLVGGSLTPSAPLFLKWSEKTLIQHHQVLHYARAFHKTSFTFAKTHPSYFHSHSLITLLLLHTFLFHRVLDSISWIFVGLKYTYCVFVLRVSQLSKFNLLLICGQVVNVVIDNGIEVSNEFLRIWLKEVFVETFGIGTFKNKK